MIEGREEVKKFIFPAQFDPISGKQENSTEKPPKMEAFSKWPTTYPDCDRVSKFDNDLHREKPTTP